VDDGLGIVATDITERVNAEEALRESEERFRQLAENIHEVFYMNDPSKKQMIYMSPAYEDIWGRTCDSLYKHPMSFLDPIHQQDRERVIATFEKQRLGEPIEVEYRIIRPDGTVRWIRSRAFPVWDELGKLHRIVGIAEDITKQKQTDQALREREKELEIKTSSLKEVNAALRVLLKRRDEDKEELEKKLLFNVKDLVVPFLERLKKSQLDPKQLSYIDILESNLNDIISPFSRTLSTKYLSLTPTEIQVANILKEGKTTKEIGELMALSPRTIETHRKNMRKKLGIEKKKGNLRSHLLTFQ
jgi:PAS domain S-box-containing protein